VWVNGAGMLVAICRWFFETFGKGIESGEEVTRGSGEVKEGACFGDMLVICSWSKASQSDFTSHQITATVSPYLRIRQRTMNEYDLLVC
jgi:hypothetical protein